MCFYPLTFIFIGAGLVLLGMILERVMFSH